MGMWIGVLVTGILALGLVVAWIARPRPGEPTSSGVERAFEQALKGAANAALKQSEAELERALEEDDGRAQLVSACAIAICHARLQRPNSARKALTLAKGLLADLDEALERYVVDALVVLGREASDHAAAERLLREGLALAKKVHGPAALVTTAIRVDLANALSTQSKPEAREVYMASWKRLETQVTTSERDVTHATELMTTIAVQLDLLGHALQDPRADADALRCLERLVALDVPKAGARMRDYHARRTRVDSGKLEPAGVA